MVNAAAAIDTGASGLAQYARAASANAVLSSDATPEPVQAAAAQGAVAANVLQAFRYNRFEFSYRQDFGKIVLLRQEPDTGEVVQQFPTDYYLERYAQSERATRQQARVPEATGQAGTENAGLGFPVSAPEGDTGVNLVADSAPAVSAAPTVAPSAPSLPGAGVGSGGTGRVDITV